MKKILVTTAMLLLTTTAMAQRTPVSVKCSFSEGKDVFNKSAVVLDSPYGGGKVATFNRKSGEVIKVVVMLEVNEDDSSLLDMTLMIDGDKNKSLGMVTATGISTASLSGVSTTLFADKNGSIYNHVNVQCNFL